MANKFQNQKIEKMFTKAHSVNRSELPGRKHTGMEEILAHSQHTSPLKVHKREIFYGSDFEIFTFS